jgi:hypothetical protein
LIQLFSLSKEVYFLYILHEVQPQDTKNIRNNCSDGARIVKEEKQNQKLKKVGLKSIKNSK